MVSMPWTTIAIVAVLGLSFAIAMLIKAHAARLLSHDQSNQVMTVWGTRHAARIPLTFGGGLIIAILAMLGFPILSVNFFVLVLVGVGVALWAHVSYFRQLQSLGLPPAYL